MKHGTRNAVGPGDFVLVVFEIALGTAGPAQGQVHRLLGARAIGGMLGALVEGHDDVGAEGDLDLHRLLGREDVRGAVEMRAKRDAFFADLAQLAEAEDLESAGVGEHGAIPRHEAVESAKLADVLVSGPQIEMVSVAENDLGAQFFEDVLGNGLHCGDGANGHEDRRFDLAMRGDDASGAGAAIAGFDSEVQGHCVDCTESSVSPRGHEN